MNILRNKMLIKRVCPYICLLLLIAYIGVLLCKIKSMKHIYMALCHDMNVFIVKKIFQYEI